MTVSKRSALVGALCGSLLWAVPLVARAQITAQPGMAGTQSSNTGATSVTPNVGGPTSQGLGGLGPGGSLGTGLSSSTGLRAGSPTEVGVTGVDTSGTYGGTAPNTTVSGYGTTSGYGGATPGGIGSGVGTTTPGAGLTPGTPSMNTYQGNIGTTNGLGVGGVGGPTNMGVPGSGYGGAAGEPNLGATTGSQNLGGNLGVPNIGETTTQQNLGTGAMTSPGLNQGTSTGGLTGTGVTTTPDISEPPYGSM